MKPRPGLGDTDDVLYALRTTQDHIDAIESARDVRTLDEWAKKQRGEGQVTVYDSQGLHWCCGLHADGFSRGFTAETPEAARHAAAEWVRSL
jgi:hypothetical protein